MLINVIIFTIHFKISRRGFSTAPVMRSSHSIPKPQDSFKRKIDNSASRPFMPIIDDKPNSMKPLVLLECVDSSGNT